MNLVCDLNNFFIRQLQVRSIDVLETAAISMNCTFDYDLFCHDKNDHKICMNLRVKVAPDQLEETPTCPYEINAEIQGFFTFADDLSEEQMGYLMRVNSATILYGILRGEIANITGSFPAGKFLLPTVMMQNVVEEIEEIKAGSVKN